MKIELNEKKYIAPKPKAKFFRQALELTQERDLENLNTEKLDELMEYICQVFGSQFDINELYDHYEGSIVELIQETLQFVVGNKGTVDTKKK